MTTYVNFTPSQTQAFQFSATLDGAQYTVIVRWLTFGARYYINVYALNGTLIVSEGLSGSPTGIALAGLSYNQLTGLVTATTTVPHGYKIGQVVGLTISGCSPAVYNGLFDCLITGASTFTYTPASQPGMATTFGAVSYNVNLVGGYFTTSSLVYRTQSGQFEISP